MDMAVANLFKHKIRFEFERQRADIEEHSLFMTCRYYRSQYIENVKSLGLNDVNDLCTVHCKPFILYVLSKVIHEDHVIPIDKVTINIGVADFQKGDDYGLTRYRFDNPLDSPELFFTKSDVDSVPFPERLLNERTYVFVRVRCYYCCDSIHEEIRFRRMFNYYRHWRYNFSIEEYLENESSDQENRVETMTEEEEIEEAFLAEHGISHAERDRMLLELRELVSFFLGRNNNNNNNITISEPLPPPIETYRQEKCVICLEATPSILYLNCMHIAVCVPCDRVKSKTSLQSTCDVCRAEISKRVKI